MKADIEDWRLVVEHWRSQGKDLRHIGVPKEFAEQLGVPLADASNQEFNSDTDEEDEDEDEDVMVKKSGKKQTPAPKKGGKTASKKKPEPKSKPVKTTAKMVSEPKPVATEPGETPASVSTPTQPETQETDSLKWKKRSQFEGDSCGFSGCTKKAVGYVRGIRTTAKEAERDKRGVWFGPACASCGEKSGMKPLTLLELASQSSSASDLARMLDIEVGDVHKRLAAVGINEVIKPPQIQQGAVVQQSTAIVPQQQQPGVSLQTTSQPEQHTIAVVVPYDVVAQVRAEMAHSIANLANYTIRDQAQMDYASTYLKRVKGMFNTLDEMRKEIARPFNQVVEQIQEHVKPALNDLKAVETTIKQKIDEGMQWANQQAQQSLQAAQAALGAGNAFGVAMATQQAMGADMALPKGVTSTPKLRWEVVNAAEVHPSFWSVDPSKVDAYLNSLDKTQVKAAVDAGYVVLNGIRVWFDNVIGSRAA